VASKGVGRDPPDHGWGTNRAHECGQKRGRGLRPKNKSSRSGSTNRKSCRSSSPQNKLKTPPQLRSQEKTTGQKRMMKKVPTRRTPFRGNIRRTARRDWTTLDCHEKKKTRPTLQTTKPNEYHISPGRHTDQPSKGRPSSYVGRPHLWSQPCSCNV